MNWILIGFAALPLLGALGLLWYRSRLGGERALMAATPTSKAADVARLAPGTIVEVKGNLRCQAPLKGEFHRKHVPIFGPRPTARRSITSGTRKGATSARPAP